MANPKQNPNQPQNQPRDKKSEQQGQERKRPQDSDPVPDSRRTPPQSDFKDSVGGRQQSRSAPDEGSRASQ